MRKLAFVLLFVLFSSTAHAALRTDTLDTGQGANELYDMDQNVLTTSSPTFTAVTVGDDAYDATSWNAATAVPTKNAVRDKIESLGTGYWTEVGTLDSLTDTTHKLAIGSASLIGTEKFSVQGSADIIQAIIRGHSTQTSNIIEVQKSDGTVNFSVSNTAGATFGGSAASITPSTGNVKVTGAADADTTKVLALQVSGATTGKTLTLAAAQSADITVTLPNATGTVALTSSNVATATALAANGANCSAGNYPLGVDASGAVESCTAIAGGTSYPQMMFVRDNTTRSATYYMAPGVQGSGTESSIYYVQMPRNGTFGNLQCTVQTDPNPGNWTAFVRTGSLGSMSNTTLTCNIASGGRVCADNSHTPTFTAGQYVTLSMVAASSPAATNTGSACSWDVTWTS